MGTPAMPPVPSAEMHRSITTRCRPLSVVMLSVVMLRAVMLVVVTSVVVTSVPTSAEETAGRQRGGLPTVTATWSGLPARALCHRLTALAGRPVILDRRLDPDTPITLDVRGASFTDVLGTVATALGGSCAILPASIRFVPGRAAATLVAADTERSRAMAGLPADVRRLATRRAPWSWDDGARPRDLLGAVAADAGIDLVGLDDIPHDHLAAAEFPQLPLTERLDLLLAQFDRRIDWASAGAGSAPVRLKIVPLPTRPQAGPPEALVVVQAGSSRRGASAPPAARPGDDRRPQGARMATWTLEVAAPLDQLLTTVAARLDLELALDHEALRREGIAPAEIIRLSVQDVDRDTLLDRIVEPVGLQWVIDGRTLRVSPKQD